MNQQPIIPGRTKWNAVKYLAIFVLACTVVLQQCALVGREISEKSVTVSDTLKSIDTVVRTYDTTIYKVPLGMIAFYKGTIPEGFYPKKSYDSLHQQYLDLLNKYFAVKIIKDTFHQQQSWVEVTDSVTSNNIVARQYRGHLEEKIVTEKEYVNTVTTNTITQRIEVPVSRRQVYFGAGVLASTTFTSPTFYGGLLYKTKKDVIIGLDAGINNSQPVYGGKLYWKIKLKKDR